MHLVSTVTIALVALTAKVASRQITVVNNCAYTVWPGLFTDPSSPSKPTQATGWQQSPHQKVSFSVPNNWKSGRIWGRTGCDFSNGAPGPNQCLTGGCNGGLRCDPKSGTGVPPVTLAEFTLGTNGQPDFYDVSIVDGFNVPMSITNNKGCHEASCKANLNPNCPAPLKGPTDRSGKVAACRSACVAGLGDKTNNPNCCTGTHDHPETCRSSGVQYYSYFKNACKDSYVFAYDEPSGTALWTCDASKAADYTITFCP